jgi:hypothetical protein
LNPGEALGVPQDAGAAAPAAALTGAQQASNQRHLLVIDTTTAAGTYTSYAPTGYVAGKHRTIRCSPAGNIVARGMALADGQELTIRMGRSTAFTFTFNSEDALANANEAFNTPGNVPLVLRAGESASLRMHESRVNVMGLGRQPRHRKNAGGSDAVRGRVNMTEGPGIALTLADDAANDEISWTIASSGSSQEDGPTTAGTYEPTLLANTKIYRVNPATDIDIVFTGFSFTGGNLGKWFILVKQGHDGRAIVKHDQGSTASNGCFTPDETDVVHAVANAATLYWYQTSSGRFNVVALPGKVDPMVDTAKSSLQLYTDTIDDALIGEPTGAEFRNRKGIAYRYYRWLPDAAAPGTASATGGSI